MRNKNMFPNYDANLRLHSTVMNDCMKEANMENCEDFIKLQSVCNTANDFVKSFRKIAFHGGNEPYIKEISRRIDNYLRQAEYVTFHDNKFHVTNKQQVRKIVWYIILNTECSYKLSLANDTNINHCLNGLPQLTKCLTLNIIWQINLDAYIFEFMEYAPIWLIVEWGEDILDSLKYADPFTTLKRIECIFKGLIKNFASCRLYKSIKQDEMTSVYHRLSDFSAALLCQFNTPPVQFEKWSTLKKSKYYGYSVYHLLQLSYEELIILEKKPLITVPEDCQLYDLLPQDKLNSNKDSECIKETLREIFNMTLNTLENVVMLVSSNTFIDWFEIDFPDPKNIDDEYTLQSMVANLAHDLVELGNALTNNEHEVFKKLQSIQYERKDVSALAKELKMSQLMEKLEKFDELCKDDVQILINEYISRTIIYNNEECLETLVKCKNVLSPKQMIGLVEIANKEEYVEDENKEKLGEILSDIIDEMNETNLLKLTKMIKGYYQCPYENIKFNCDMEDVLYNINVDKIEILRYIIKDPQKFLESAIDVMQNTHKFNSDTHKKIVEHYFKGFELVFPTLTEPCNHSILNRMLEQILSLNSCSDFNSVLHFNVMLYKSKFLTKADYVKNILVKSISQSKTEGFTQKCINVGQIIQKILDFEDLSEHLPPFLVMFGLILNETRENLASYSDRAVELLEKVIATIKKLLNRFLPHASEKEKNFITIHLQNTSLLSKFYYQKLTLEKNQEVKTLESFLHPNGGFKSMKKPMITACFCEYLSKCTKKELLYLSENKEYFDFFNDAMKVIALSVNEYESTFILDFCLNNYNHMFQMMVRNVNLTVSEMIGLLKGSSNILKVLPQNQKTITSYAMLPHFKKLIETILQVDKEKKIEIENVLAQNSINIIISLDMMFPKD